jgi:uncharacterized protein YciI
VIIIQLTYKVPLAEIDHYLAAHRDFLEYYYKQNILIASGPLNPRTGGIIIAASKDQAYIETIFKQDPFYQADLADYQFLSFTPVKHCDALKVLIQDSEGKLG